MSPRDVVKTKLASVTPMNGDGVSSVSMVSIRKAPLQQNKENTKLPDPVSLDSRFNLPKCQLPPQEEFIPVETFVANAIRENNQGGDKKADPKTQRAYRAILDSLRRREDPPMLWKVLLALRTAGKGSTLHQLSSSSTRHAHLLHLIFRLDPFVPPAFLDPTKQTLDKRQARLLEPFQNYALADAHLHLLLALVSANSVFLSPALNALWRLLLESNENAPTERVARVHATVATMLRLVPKGNTELFPIMASNFPFRTRPTPEVVWYAKQCLFVLEYIPTIHGQVLELIIDKGLEMDVEIKIQDGGQVTIDRSAQNDDEDDLFQLDLDDSPVKAADPVETDAEEQVDEMADKLDSLMVVLFQHLKDMTQLQPDSARNIYQMVSPVFDSSVLTTHRSKFVQFVMLLICGVAESPDKNHSVDLYRDFAAKLIDIVLDPYRATVTRQSGACYLASFISRASYVCSETVCEAISALLRWAEAYILSPNGYASRNGADAHDQCEIHALFYTVCQSAFYIMCFRGTEGMKYYLYAKEYHKNQAVKIMETDESSLSDSLYPDLEHVDIGPKRWAMICGHNLQPLRFCLESVRGEFLQCAARYRLLEPRLLSKLNADSVKLSTGRDKRSSGSLICTAATLAKRRMKGGVGGLGRGANPLDSFFPYDPYLLRRSHPYIEPFYKNWEGSVEYDDVLEDHEEQGDAISDDESDGELSDGSSEADEEDRVVHMPESVESTSFLQVMSHNSNATGASHSTRSSHPYGSPDIPQRRPVPQGAWTDTLKRARAPSIENGSW